MAISVAIDGPAGAGKSTISRAVAKKLGYFYIDTGAMYRTVAVYAAENGIDVKRDKEKLVNQLDDIKIGIKYVGDMQHMFLNGKDISDKIRENDASMGASAVAVIPDVRKRLVAMQQEMACHGNVIMDGRDIATTVLPNAELKIYLTASVEERARRRYCENIEKGIECTFEEVKADVEARDKQDMTREVSPLVKAPDAELVDTTNLSFDESTDLICDMVRKTEKGE